MLTGLQILSGLAGNTPVSGEKIFSLMRPLLPPGIIYKISDAELNSMISGIMRNHVVLESSVAPSNPAAIKTAISGIVQSTLRDDKALAYMDDLRAAFETLGSEGYAIFQRGDPALKSSAPAPAQRQVAQPRPQQQQRSAPVSPETSLMQETRTSAAASASRTQASGTGNEILDNILGVVAGVVDVRQQQLAQKAARKAEVQRLRNEMYDQNSGSKGKQNLVTYGLIGGGLLVVGLVVFLVARKKTTNE